MSKANMKGVEYGSVDLRDDILQVFANANKIKHLESREDRRTSHIKGDRRQSLRSRDDLAD